LKSWATRNQIVIFIFLSIIISWLPWHIGGSGFFAWGPSLAGLITMLAVDGWQGIVAMLRRLVHWRASLVWWGAALLLPFILTAIAIGAHVWTGGTPPPFTFLREEMNLLPLLLLVLISPMGGPGGEEAFGWRNYGQDKMQAKWPPLKTSAVIGVVWALWHLPEFFNPTSTQYAAGLGFIAPMTVMWIATSILMTWLYNHTGGSTLIGGVIFHLALDVSSVTLLADFSMTGMSEGIPPLDMRLVSFQIAVFAFLALVVSLVTRGQLGLVPSNSKTHG
jgi:membrane protease YdiL (CAAX protease family)